MNRKEINCSGKKYKTILIDPPWEYNRKWDTGSKKALVSNKVEAKPLPYNTMSISEIKSLPVIDLACENCEVYVWVTQKYLPHIFGIIKHWGLKYCQTLTWCKKPMGKGQGGIFTPTTEFLILARVGKIPKKSRVDSTWFLAKREKKHSKKPDVFQALIEQVSDSPRLEMFARRKLSGWDVWGNEIEGEEILIDHLQPALNENHYKNLLF